MPSTNVNPLSNVASVTHFLLTVTNPGGTFLKKDSTEASRNLPADKKCEIPEGAVVGVLTYIEVENNHYKVTFSLKLGKQQYNTWHVYRPHVSINELS
ncbi:MAG: hypothetical protein QNJ47_05060 [Nostocaceae cyanobacterium]|nr:hypothetical protein [Nostocaceae cyanobacterium]